MYLMSVDVVVARNMFPGSYWLMVNVMDIRARLRVDVGFAD